MCLPFLPNLGSVPAGSRSFRYDTVAGDELWTPLETQHRMTARAQLAPITAVCVINCQQKRSSPSTAHRSCVIYEHCALSLACSPHRTNEPQELQRELMTSRISNVSETGLGGEQQQRGVCVIQGGHSGTRGSRYSRFKCFPLHGGLSSAYLVIPCQPGPVGRSRMAGVLVRWSVSSATCSRKVSNPSSGSSVRSIIASSENALRACILAILQL